MLAWPDADVPVAQLSLVRGADPGVHFAIGQALKPLRDEGVFIITSGLTFHNMRGFGDPGFVDVSKKFDGWLNEAATLPQAERDARTAAALLGARMQARATRGDERHFREREEPVQQNEDENDDDFGRDHRPVGQWAGQASMEPAADSSEL